MSNCHKQHMSASQSEKSGPRELTHEQACDMLNRYPKPRPQDLTHKYPTCYGCASSTCLSCPEEDFMPDYMVESVSDDLVLLRCQLCELNYPALSKFVPEPWFNMKIIQERLMMIRQSIDHYVSDASTRYISKLCDILVLIDHLDATLEDGDE